MRSVPSIIFMTCSRNPARPPLRRPSGSFVGQLCRGLPPNLFQRCLQTVQFGVLRCEFGSVPRDEVFAALRHCLEMLRRLLSKFQFRHEALVRQVVEARTELLGGLPGAPQVRVEVERPLPGPSHLDAGAYRSFCPLLEPANREIAAS